MNRLLFISIFICTLLIGCSSPGEEDPLKEQLVPVLEQNYGGDILQYCTFSLEIYHRFYRKPEFIGLREEKICEGSFEIDELEYFSEDSVRATFRIAYSANRPVVRNFLSGWNDLRERYETLESMRVPDPQHGFVWTYTDPFDNDIFIRYPDSPPGVFSTRRWEQLTMLKTWFKDLSENKAVYSDTHSVIMVKNDEWEIVIE